MMVSLRILSICAAQLVLASENKVFAPDSGITDGPLLVLFPSVGIPSEHYEPTVVAIQRASKQPLWAVIASTEAGCDASFKAALDAAAKEGWAPLASAASTWLLGHEDNETCAEKMLTANAAAGAVFMGALPGDEFDFANSKPTFILSAELHGGAARPGRAVAWWRRRVELIKEVGVDKALLEKPMVILPGQNSGNFCPGFDVLGDLEAEVDQTAATSHIGEAVGVFIDGIYEHEASEIMGALADQTEVLLQPLLTALDMEHISTGGLNVNGSSPYCEKAQLILAGLSSEDEARVEWTDQYNPRLAYNYSSTPPEDPTGTLMHCHSNTSTGDKLNVLLCSWAGYDGANSSGTDKFRFYDGAAAGEIGCKMSSSDYLALKLNTTAEHSDRDCASINKYALETAQSLLSDEQTKRWQRRGGRGICVVEDRQTPGNVGPYWIYGTANYTETESCLQVEGFHLKLEVDAGHLPGVEYCKLMSPAFAVDYLLTGSMKAITATKMVLV